MNSLTPEQSSLEEIHARLSDSRGKRYWRCLEELEGDPEFQKLVEREFPSHASEWNDPIGRRRFLQLMGASLGLAGLTGCTRPAEKIVPYVRPPYGIVAGKPLYFATSMTLRGVGSGLLVRSEMGRPIKVEGNPDHPGSLGATDAYAQASVLTLYDPDRSQTVLNGDQISTWDSFMDVTLKAVIQQRKIRGAGLRILTETVSSPTLHAQLQNILQEFPLARWHQYEPVNRDMAREGSRLVFGEDVHAVYRLDRADFIVSLDADFLSCGIGNLRYAREFALRRKARGADRRMNRLYVFESTPTPTGAKADHRFSIRPGEMIRTARIIDAAIGSEEVPNSERERLVPLLDDLTNNMGSGLVIPGEHQSPLVHGIAHLINHELRNTGETVRYTRPVEAASESQMDSLRALVSQMEDGSVELLVIVGGNPVYTAPADIPFAEALKKVKLRVHLSLYHDETSVLCQWHIPEAHFLEAWSDTRAYDGTASIIQPLIEPLYGGKSAHELLAAISSNPLQNGYELVRNYWKKSHRGADFESFWRTSVHNGIIEGTAFPELKPEIREGAYEIITGDINSAGRENPSKQSEKGESGRLEVDIVFRPDPTIFDGRFANNGWLQELPKPLTHLTWDNAILLSQRTAERLGFRNRPALTGGEHGQVLADVMVIEHQGRILEGPAWIVPGHPDDCVTVHLGYGRTRAGRSGSLAGFNASRIRTADSPWYITGARLSPAGRTFPLACTQYHHLIIEGRDLIRSGSLEQYKRDPHLGIVHHEDEEASLYPRFEYEGYKWGMAIDLNACIGCSACVVACQSENNIPIVGRTEVMRGREMHWLRVDMYHNGSAENPETHFQPVPCMQCENAPCEVVCPVGATVHSTEGLNDMVYNRCVGTRYCSNNCPYKVRRFNFLQYSDYKTPSMKLLQNPQVTVRTRGVMEKCTYCVQRIIAARITVEKEERKMRDGEVVTACQAVCPAEAIIFGDINDPNSKVAKLKKHPLNYSLLEELNTRPRTTYLAAIKNPNPDFGSGE